MKTLMKKIRNAVILLVLILGVAFTVGNTSIDTVQAASTRTKAINSYKKFLKRGSFTTSYGRTYIIHGFTTIDINKDGIPELIIESEGDRGISVFTYTKGKVRMLSDWIGQVWAWDKKGDYIEYNTSQKALIVRTHGGTGLAGYDLVPYKHGKVYSRLNIYMSCQWMNGKVTSRSCGYTKWGGESRGCSYNTYKKFRRNYFTGRNVKKYYFIRNTASKRNKLR